MNNILYNRKYILIGMILALLMILILVNKLQPELVIDDNRTTDPNSELFTQLIEPKALLNYQEWPIYNLAVVKQMVGQRYETPTEANDYVTEYASTSNEFRFDGVSFTVYSQKVYRFEKDWEHHQDLFIVEGEKVMREVYDDPNDFPISWPELENVYGYCIQNEIRLVQRVYCTVYVKDEDVLNTISLDFFVEDMENKPEQIEGFINYLLDLMLKKVE